MAALRAEPGDGRVRTTLYMCAAGPSPTDLEAPGAGLIIGRPTMSETLSSTLSSRRLNTSRLLSIKVTMIAYSGEAEHSQEMSL